MVVCTSMRLSDKSPQLEKNMKTFKIDDQRLYSLRSLRCQMGDKFNRIYKIASNAPQLLSKLDGFIEHITTERAQCALATKICIKTGIRIGNEDSAEGYMTKPHPMQKEKEPEFRQTFGLTTLRKEHVRFVAGAVRFEFVGKKGVEQVIIIRDKKLVSQVRQLYTESLDDTLFSVNDVQVRKFVKKSVGSKFMVKDFRTLHANMVATDVITQLCKKPLPQKKSEFNLEVRQIAETVAARLGNTPGISKKSYIDPLMFDLHYSRRWASNN